VDDALKRSPGPSRRGGTAEHERLEATRSGSAPWRKWGTYVSDRQWGTVREDRSESGDAWNALPHDHARSFAYRWGEDGIAGLCDSEQRLCFALALWNGRDAILKERLFGLTNSEGNHGEDVKEYYFHLDATPTCSYAKYLYKYPLAAFPYDDLVDTNRRRGRQDFEYELLDTGVFDGDRYVDVFVEYAKADAEDILIRITLNNRGPEEAELHVLPTLWFRNDWSDGSAAERPGVRPAGGDGFALIDARHPALGAMHLACEGDPALLFTENETNRERLYGSPNPTPHVKDGIDACVVGGRAEAVNPAREGTKAAAHYRLRIPAGGERQIRLRLARPGPSGGAQFDGFDAVFDARRAEADAFYGTVIPHGPDTEEYRVIRQALAGLLWTNQFYYYDLDRWLSEHGADPFRADRKHAPRNEQWQHMYNADVISMPDKWEYPWYAAWDLAFHVLALTLVDPDFGKRQLDLVLGERYLHPNGQVPAYEWNFGDVNPPVHAWATIFTYRVEALQHGAGDRDWLSSCFHRLLLNFTWWVNRKDRSGSNVFEGGFLGLDNIGVFDRSAPLPQGGHLEQADGTAWMALFCLNMLEIAGELSREDPGQSGMVLKFAQHFVWIASAMARAGGGVGMWDEEDGFFYDVLHIPGRPPERLKVRSMVGLLPLCAVTVFDGSYREAYPEAAEQFRRFLATHPELVEAIHDPEQPGVEGRRLGSVLSDTRLRRVLARMLDENEFLSPFGIRSLSRHHAEHPYSFWLGDQEHRVAYLPAESDSGMFGGNSNWRGPIWMPVNALIVRALLQYYTYYGDDFRVECPTGSGNMLTLYEVAREITRRLTSIFLPDASGRRPVHGGTAKFQEDPHWRDHILFYEYFHGDNGAGLGASHQTGWTAVIARLMHLFATAPPEALLREGKRGAFMSSRTR
jgi:hypothetical protein